MKTILSTLILACLFSTTGCSNKVIPLQHTYQDGPYQFSVSLTKDDIWTKLVEALTSKGLAVQTIDKNTGLISTGNISFLNAYSFEDKEGNLSNPGSLVVCTKVRGPFTFNSSIKPDSVMGQWTVLTKQTDGKTLIAIRLVNAYGKIVVEENDIYGKSASRETHHLGVKSTGVFEKSVEAAFK